MDTSFSSNGRTAITVKGGNCAQGGHCNDHAERVATDSHGRIVVVGSSGVVRLKPNGKLDRSFSGDGRLKAHGASRVAIDDEDRILLDADGAVIRLNVDGSLDQSFGDNGRTVGPGGPVALESNGDIVVASNGVKLERYDPDGQPDPTFQSDVAHFGHEEDGEDPNPSYPSDIVIDDEGRILVSGSGSDPTANISRAGLARFLPDGSLDPSFGPQFGGQGVTYACAGYDGTNVLFFCNAQFNALALDSRGRIVVGGAEHIDRFLPDGKPDPAFSEVHTGVKGRGHRGYSVDGIAIDRENRIAATGPPETGGFRYPKPPGAKLARYKANGALDESFAKRDKVTLGFFNELELDLQPIPPHRTLGICHFPTFYSAMEAAQSPATRSAQERRSTSGSRSRVTGAAEVARASPNTLILPAWQSRVFRRIPRRS